jgi:hypothetical protein
MLRAVQDLDTTSGRPVVPGGELSLQLMRSIFDPGLLCPLEPLPTRAYIAFKLTLYGSFCLQAD